jgi:guanylate kinase
MDSDHTALHGTLFVVSAPSGAGKTSLVRALLAHHPALRLSISYTTREPRVGEIDGEHYHFVSVAHFEAMINDHAFIEYAQVFTNYYGTALNDVYEIVQSGHDMLLEIDWQGARQVRHRFPAACTIFIAPPSYTALEERLRQRGQDDETVIARRMAAAYHELSHFDEYQYLIINDQFDAALADLNCLVRSHQLRMPRQQTHIQPMLSAKGYERS